MRRWDALERSRGEAPVIDFDCAPPTNPPNPFPSRFAALDELCRLRSDKDPQHPALRAHLDAHSAYLRALIGEQLPFDQYILTTQGCAARGWTPDYVEHRAQMAKDVLASLGVSWDRDTWVTVRALSEQLPAVDVGPAIVEDTSKYEQAVRRLADTDAQFNLAIEDWVISPDDEIVTARTRLDHFTNLVRARIHIMLNNGAAAADCRDVARHHVPWWTDEEIARELYDRSRNPQFRSYLWAYPAGIDWFVRLVEAGGTTLAEVLREAYQRPLTPTELHELWPTGPTIGGDE